MDQAQTLRELTNNPPALHLKLEGQRRAPDRISIVITSGKGGVGKSTLATNIAAAFSLAGMRTLLVDGDLMFPNLDLFFGVRPRLTAVEAVVGRLPLEQACVAVAENLWLLPMRATEARFLGIESELVRQMIRFVELQVGFEAVVVDTASGLSGRSSDFASIAKEMWVVTTPSAPAIADAYAMVKYLWSIGRTPDLALCLNGVKNGRQALELHRRFNEVTRQFLRREIRLAGWIPYDSKVDGCLEQGVPIVFEKPKSGLTQAVQRIARELVERRAMVETATLQPEVAPAITG